MSSGFITESELDEIRKKRQEEWEKVRKASDPLERPEEPLLDRRSLFERLQEQKQKKDLEYEEAHKLKNMIKGLDDDEIEFLDLVDRTKLAADRTKELEEKRELADYRKQVATLQEKNYEERLQAEINVSKPKNNSNNKLSQQKLLKGVIIKVKGSQKRKMTDSGGSGEQLHKKQSLEKGNDEKDITWEGSGEPLCKRPSLEKDGDRNNTTLESQKPCSNETSVSKTSEKLGADEVENWSDVGIPIPNSSLRCVAILPGLGSYTDSSSEDNSSDSEIEIFCRHHVDLLGRKIEKKPKE